MTPRLPQPDISVIVVTYNRDEPLKRTLECLLNQDPPAREIIVVDQTREHTPAVREFLDLLVREGRINYIFQAEPNAQRARNRAIAEARGEVVLFVDDDVAMDEKLVGAHWMNYGDPELCAVCGYYTDPGENSSNVLPDDCLDTVTGWIYFPHSYSKRVPSHLLPSGNGSMRRAAAVRLGGFDENYVFTHFDDTDLACRMKAAGMKAIHDPDARLVHLREEKGGKRPGGVNDFVIADSNRWYTWVYFFWMNFRWNAWRELGRRFRRCVLRRKNITRPWYLAVAFVHFLSGTVRATKAIRGGRRLGFAEDGAQLRCGAQAAGQRTA